MVDISKAEVGSRQKTPLVRIVPIWIAIALLSVGLVFKDTPAGLICISIGAVLAIAIMILRMRVAENTGADANPMSDLISNDPRALIVSDTSGKILDRNAVSVSQFGAKDAAGLEKLLGNAVPNAAAVIFRLQTKALEQGFATEQISGPKGVLTITTHKTGRDHLIWALSDAVLNKSSESFADAIALPFFVTNAAGSIKLTNASLRDMVGNRAKSVNMLFEKTPRESGRTAELLTLDGPKPMRPIILKPTPDRIEYYLTPPVQAHSGVASLDFLEEFPVALMKISPDGNVLEANKLSRGLMGTNFLNEQQLPDLVEGLGRPISDWLSEAFEGRALHKPEVLKVKSGETETYVQITLGRMIKEGEIALLAMLNDATELKTLEAQFVQSQKMQAIGQLAGGVAHDFNNLLTAISGHCDLLMLRHDPGDAEYGDLEQINQNANRAASLVGQLLAFSRKQNLQLEVIDMRDTLADLTHLLNRLVGAQISLTLNHDPQLMSVRSDRRQLEQVIMNLVVNARDAMSAGGEITIETRNVKLKHDMHRDRAIVPFGDYVMIKVADNGRGIPQDKLTKIFEPFFTTKRTGEGTGLGLSTAYGIIKQSGGFIFVDSTVGEGTTFTIFFPSAETPELPPVETPANREKVDLTPAEGVVLLVEDEAPVRAFASRALKLRGFDVVEAENAEEAITLLGDGLEVDVVVSDVVMPGMDGPTWVKLARETHPDLRVIFVSGYAEDSFGEAQAALKNTVFLPKPFSLNELTNMVQSQISLSS